MIIKRTLLILVIAHIVFNMKLIYAQNNKNVINGIISGKVIDVTTKQPLTGVNVYLLNNIHGAATDRQGNYIIENVPIGRYTITVKMIGYEQRTVADITVVPKRTTIINFELKLKAIELSEVTIKPEYFSKTNTFSVISETSIDNKEIRTTPGVPDMFRRLQSVAGIVRSTDFSPALIVRGSDPEDNLTLLENIEIYSPFHFSNLGGTIMSDGMSIIEPRLIQSVKLSTGGFGIKYGDRLSSVTQIALLEPEKRRINSNISMDMGGFSMSFSGPINSKISWLIAGRRGIWDLFMEMQGKDDHPKTIDIHTKIIYEPSTKHKLTFSALYVQDDYWRIKNDDDLGTIEEKKFRQIKKDLYAIGLNWRWLFSKNGYILLTPYLNFNNWKMNEGAIKNKDQFGYKNMEDFYGLKGEMTYRFLKNHTLLIGGDFRGIDSKYAKWSDLDTLRTGEIISPYNILFGPETSYKSAFYIQYSIIPFNWTELHWGLRNDYFEFNNENVISPRFGAIFNISRKTKINIAYGLYAQFPQFYKIFLNPLNKTLKTSKAIHYILGLDYLLRPDMQFRIEAFYKDLKYLPVSENDTSTIYASIGSGFAKGLEFTLTKKMTKNIYILINYTNTVSKRKENMNSSFYNFKYDSPHTINIMTTYKLNNWWEFSLTYRYASGLPYTPYDLSTRTQVGDFWYCEKSIINSNRLPNYQRLDLRIDRRFIFKSWNLSIFLEIWNLTNHPNLIMYEYNSDFTKKEAINSMFSFMPMFGIVAEF
jgi:hypothetical protein